MDSLPAASLRASFAALPDPRSGPALRHEVLDIVSSAVLAVRCGADSWVAIELYGRSKEPWLRTFLALPHGVPSHDTFGRVFAALDPAAFERGFLGWVQAVTATAAGGLDTHEQPGVAIDGKTLRRSHDRAAGQGPLHLVSAWATDQGLVLGQRAVPDKSNEITAIPALLDVLDVKGAIVTIDAMGCQTAIARRIRKRERSAPAQRLAVGRRMARRRRPQAGDEWSGLVRFPNARSCRRVRRHIHRAGPQQRPPRRGSTARTVP